MKFRGLGSHMSMEKRRFIHSLLFPLFFLFIIFSIKLVESLEGLDLSEFGIWPLHKKGLLGILTSPLIHGNWEHLYSNAVSFFILGVTLFYFYNKIAYKVFVIIYLLGGLGVWIAARDSWHIGASGVIYGIASFLAISGIIRKHISLIAISLLVIFFYGGLIWGAFPFKFNLPYSWEGHFWGGLVGIMLAFIFKNEGPQRPVSTIEDDEETEGGEEDDPYWMQGTEEK